MDFSEGMRIDKVRIQFIYIYIYIYIFLLQSKFNQLNHNTYSVYFRFADNVILIVHFKKILINYHALQSKFEIWFLCCINVCISL